VELVVMGINPQYPVLQHIMGAVVVDGDSQLHRLLAGKVGVGLPAVVTMAERFRR
jgi:hypothetical protein